MQNERLNLPSASGMERLVLCPGSFRLEATVPPEPDTEYSVSGTRIHAALAEFANRSRDPEPGTLDEREARTYQMCTQVYDRIVERWLDPNLPNRATNQWTEQREWCFEGLVARYSGQYDVLLIEGRRALCLDYKTFPGDQTDAVANWQLRALAVLVAENHDVDEVTVAIIQPWRTMDPVLCLDPVLCRYDEADLADARAAVLAALVAARSPDAPRVPGERACKFCRAKWVCPEAQAIVTTLAALAGDAAGAETNEDRIARIAARLDPAQMPRLIEAAAVAELVAKAIVDRAKQMLRDDPGAIPGYNLSKGRQIREITSAHAAWEAVRDMVSAEDFVRCGRFSLPKLERVFAAKAKMGQSTARMELERRLGKAVTRSTAHPSLTRVNTEVCGRGGED